MMRTIWRNLCAGIALLAGAAQTAPLEPGFVISSLNSQLEEGIWRISAQSQLILPEKPKEALFNGLALNFQIDISLIEERKWLWDEHIVTDQLRYRLSFHNLTGRFRLQNLVTDEDATYRSLAEALNAIGDLDRYPLIDNNDLAPDSTYRASLQVALDASQLPAPLRPTAFLSADWRMVSPLVSWSIP